MSSLKVGKYYIDFTQILGKGSTGNVYKGTNLETNETLAIKAIEMSKVTGQVAKYLLDSEKKALNTIKSNYVIKTYDILQFNDYCYIIMEYCASGSLKDYITQKGKLSNLEAINMFKKILIGYIAISEALFIHRDLKTANILIRVYGDPVIIDFGYCEMMMAKRPMIQYNVGSPSYMAPEVYYKSRYSEKGDVWSLGVILYEMLTGKTLDNGLDMHQYFRSMQKDGKPKIQIQGISQVAKDILDLALQVSPEKRATCHKLKYIIDRSLIPQIQSQLNRVLSPKMSKNTEQVSSVKFIPATKFNYEPVKTEDPEETQKQFTNQGPKFYGTERNSRHTQSSLGFMQSPQRNSWTGIKSSIYPLTPTVQLQSPFKSPKYDPPTQINSMEQSKFKPHPQFNNNIQINASSIVPSRKQSYYQHQQKVQPPMVMLNVPYQQFSINSPKSMTSSVIHKIK